MNLRRFLVAAAVLVLLVAAVIAVLVALPLPEGFFRENGVVAGPAAGPPARRLPGGCSGSRSSRESAPPATPSAGWSYRKAHSRVVDALIEVLVVDGVEASPTAEPIATAAA